MGLSITFLSQSCKHQIMTIKTDETVENQPIKIKFKKLSGNDYMNLGDRKNCLVEVPKLLLFSKPKKIKEKSQNEDKNLRKILPKSKKIKKIKKGTKTQYG